VRTLILAGKLPKYTVIHGVYLQFWPTLVTPNNLIMKCYTQCQHAYTHDYTHTRTHTSTHTHTHKHTHTHTHTHVKTCTWCLLRGLHNILRTTCGRNTNSKIVHRHLLHKNTYQTPVVLYTTCRICRVLGPPTIQHWPELPYHFWWKDCAATVCSNSKTE
jgi:hypothetical protein